MLLVIRNSYDFLLKTVVTCSFVDVRFEAAG